MNQNMDSYDFSETLKYNKIININNLEDNIKYVITKHRIKEGLVKN